MEDGSVLKKAPGLDLGLEMTGAVTVCAEPPREGGEKGRGAV